jgi:hypothetical protein
VAGSKLNKVSSALSAVRPNFLIYALYFILDVRKDTKIEPSLSRDPESKLHVIPLPLHPTSILLDTSPTIYPRVREKSLLTDTVPYLLS